jgi:hypothetical protein
MSRETFETEDPLELVGMVMPGEPGQLEAMAECLVEEYIRMGWNEEQLMRLFVDPMFMATYRVYRQLGYTFVQDLIQRTCEKWKFLETLRGENDA